MVNVATPISIWLLKIGLRQTNSKFEQRFRYIEKELKKKNKPLKEATLEEMDELWEEAKSEFKILV